MRGGQLTYVPLFPTVTLPTEIYVQYFRSSLCSDVTTHASSTISTYPLPISNYFFTNWTMNFSTYNIFHLTSDTFSIWNHRKETTELSVSILGKSTDFALPTIESCRFFSRPTSFYRNTVFSDKITLWNGFVHYYLRASPCILWALTYYVFIIMKQSSFIQETFPPNV